MGGNVFVSTQDVSDVCPEVVCVYVRVHGTFLSCAAVAERAALPGLAVRRYCGGGGPEFQSPPLGAGFLQRVLRAEDLFPRAARSGHHLTRRGETLPRWCGAATHQRCFLTATLVLENEVRKETDSFIS